MKIKDENFGIIYPDIRGVNLDTFPPPYNLIPNRVHNYEIFLKHTELTKRSCRFFIAGFHSEARANFKKLWVKQEIQY